MTFCDRSRFVRALLVSVALPFALSQMALAEDGDVKVAGWLISSIADSHGSFAKCTMTLLSPQNLDVAVDRDASGLHLRIGYSRWTLPSGDVYDGSLRVDAATFPVKLKVESKNEVSLTSADPGLFPAVAGSKSVGLNVAHATLNLPVSNSADAFTALETCYTSSSGDMANPFKP